MSNIYNVFNYYEKEENIKKKHKLQEFKFPTKKKFSFNPTTKTLPDSTVENQYYIKEILEPCERQKDNFECETSEEKNRESVQKSITWRSPLVLSPAVKFSPRIYFQNTQHRGESDERHGLNESNNETFETSTSSKTTLTINIQKSPNRNENSKNNKRSRGSQFLLRDRDYDDTNNEQGNDTMNTIDICSSSFLDKVGWPTSQRKPTSKINKTSSSPTLDYYSQYLTVPVKSQKQKTSSTTISEPDQNTKNDNLDTKENLRGVSNLNKTIPDKIFTQQATEPDKQESFSQTRYASSQQLLTKRDNSPNPLQDVTNSYREHPRDSNFIQDRAIPYSNNQHLPQLEINRNYRPHNFPAQKNNVHYSNEVLPDDYIQPNYHQNRENINYYPQDYQRWSNFSQNSNGMDRTFNGNNMSVRSWSHNPTVYNYHRNIPRSSQYNADSSRMYRNVPFQADFETGCNQSQIVEDIPNYEEYHQPQQHSQYFQRNLTSIKNNPYQLIMSEGDCRILRNSQTERMPQTRPSVNPEMLSLQQLSQTVEAPCTQTNENRSFVQRKSFEEKMNEENTLRSMENSYYGLAGKTDASSSSQNFVRNCDDRNDPRFLPYPNCQKSGFYQRDGRNSQRIIDRGLNESLRNFNRSLSFEERPDFNAAQQRRGSEYIHGPRREDMNRSFCGRSCCWNSQDQNYQNSFGQTSLNRSFVAPARSHFPEQNFGTNSSSQDMRMFLPNDDKKYVMNKFLYSLDQQ